MAEVLQLYNVFGATTERTMLEVPLALGQRGHRLTFAAEAMDADAPAMESPVLGIKRISVKPTDDIDRQMKTIAEAALAVDQQFDIVHAHFGPRCLHAARYLHRGVPTVISTYGYDVSRLLTDPCWAARYRWMGDRGAVFVALSQDMYTTLVRAGVPGDQVEVIPLGIDLQQWKYKPHQVPDRFLFVGRFVPKKGPVWAINALALMLNRGTQATLTMVGSGSRMQDWALREQVRLLKIEPWVKFVGRVPYENLPAIMRDATALVAPSQIAPDGDAEGCPMVLMQAQALGTPVITTRHAGNPEALPPEAQKYVVEECDPNGLAAAMEAMMKLSVAQRTALQGAGRAWIETRFDIERTVDRYDALYRRLIEKKEPPPPAV